MAGTGIRTVAEQAGVSIGTVSKILNPTSSANIRVSAETREKVLATANRLGYRPSYGAKLLRGERTHTIGFAVTLPGDHNDTYLSNYSFRLLNGIGREASRRHYQVLLIQGEDYRYYMDVKRIDALILIGFPLDDNPLADQMRAFFEHLNAGNYPYVVINNQLPGVTAAGIGVDNRSGMRQIADLIRQRQYKSVGFIGELTKNPQRHHVERIRYLQEYLAGSGCSFDDNRILNGCGRGIPEVPRIGRYSHEDGRVGLHFLQARNLMPRCIVCGNDDIATGLLQAARAEKIRIPEDLAIIGFDDDENSSYQEPALTTVHQPLEEFGRLAVSHLLKKIDDPTHSIQITIEPELIERSTT